MKRWLVFLLIVCCLLPASGAWAEGVGTGSPPALSTARYQVPYCAVREGIFFSGSYAADLSTAYVHACNFDRFNGQACFNLDALVERNRVTYLSLVLYQGNNFALAQRFLFFLPANWAGASEGQGEGIRLDQLDTRGHDFFGGLLEDFWPMPVPYEKNPFLPLMMLFSPLTSQTGQYQPLPNDVCKEFRSQLQALLPMPLAVGTSSFEFGGEKLGQCCRLSAWGWGATVGVQANDRVRQFFSDLGWTPVLRFFADGIFGSIAGYQQGTKLAVVELMMEPMADVVISPDIPISAQEIPDEKWHYELTISLAELP